MNKGFTLIEFAFVIIIVGVLLTGIVRSVEMVESARSKRILAEASVMIDAQNSFFERTGRFAGDTNNDGIIGFATINRSPSLDGISNSENDADRAFNELKSLNLLADKDNSEIAIQSSREIIFYAGQRDSSGNQNLLVIRNISCSTALQLEINFDNNKPANLNSASTGIIRTINGNSLALNTSWSDSNLCPKGEDRRVNAVYIYR